MKELSIYEQYDFYVDSFNHIGTFLLSSDLEDIEYCIFEEFDSDCTSFFHKNTLSALLAGNLISENVFFMSLDLAAKFKSLENTPLWNAMSVKSDIHWLEILTLADKIKSLLNITQGHLYKP